MTFDMNNKQLYTKAIKPIKNISIKETPLDSKGNIDFSKINILEKEKRNGE